MTDVVHVSCLLTAWNTESSSMLTAADRVTNRGAATECCTYI